MKRIPWIAATIVVAPTACADDVADRVTTVAIAATPCDRPNARLGVGTVVADGLVLTAAHVVEDALRDVAVDGRPARVVVLDARTDAALLAVETTHGMAVASMSSVDVGETVRIVTPTDVIDTAVERIVMLSVDDTTDGVVYRRRAVVLAVTAPGGTSGAPVVDDRGRVVGIVNISHSGRDVTYATRTSELQTLIDSVASRFDAGQESVTRSSLAAQEPCA